MSDYPTDMRGFVHIEKDGETAEVLPESVPVWLEQGFSVVEDEKQAADQPDTTGHVPENGDN